MHGPQKLAGLAIIAALGFHLTAATAANAQAAATTAAPAGQDAAAAKPQYTMAEYNAYQAAAAEKNPAQQVKALDDFASKYPNSALMIYIYPLYYQAYSQLKNYPKVIEYADKVATLGEKVDAGARYQALYARAFAYNAIIADPTQAKTGATDPALAKAAQDAAVAGLKALDEVKKPDALTEDAFATQKKQIQIYFNGTAAQAAMVQKNYPDAIKFYKAVLVLNPDDAITSYRLGLAYSTSTPPQQMDAFWSIARAVTAKGATQAQSAKVKDYLRKLIVNYQQAACDNLTDAELNELLQLASSSPDRPDTYKLPSADELTAARKDMTMKSVIDDLKAGGDKAKVTWLAACGLEFPEVPGKVIEVTPGTDSVQLKVAFVTSEAEFDAATTPNLDVKVVGQPEAGKLEKNGAVHFTGTLLSFDPDPNFMLHWDKAKVKEEDLPKEGTKKPAARRPAAKKPS
jgi:tetratricopeptide (TPR) repeat protein